MTDLKISAADARLILVAIDKLPPSFYSTEAYGAAIRLHQQLIRHDIAATDPDPVRANGFIRAYGGDTIFYRYCADPEAFDAKIRKLRPEDYRAGEKKWRTIWAWC